MLLLSKDGEEPDDLRGSKWRVETPNSEVCLRVEKVEFMGPNCIDVTLVAVNRAGTARLQLAARGAGGKFHPQMLQVTWSGDEVGEVFFQDDMVGCEHIYERVDLL